MPMSPHSIMKSVSLLYPIVTGAAAEFLVRSRLFAGGNIAAVVANAFGMEPMSRLTGLVRLVLPFGQSGKSLLLAVVVTPANIALVVVRLAFHIAIAAIHAAGIVVQLVQQFLLHLF